jgi:hypothetical protein
MAIINARSIVDWSALFRLDLKEPGDKVAWIENPSLSLLLIAFFFSLGFHASRALIQAMY